MPRRKVALVPHTHWDREWYEPFEFMRLRLADAVDAILAGSYAHFLFDGQMAMVEDYLALRPEAAPWIRELALRSKRCSKS